MTAPKGPEETSPWEGNFVTYWSLTPRGATPGEYAQAICSSWCRARVRFRARLHADSVAHVVVISIEVIADDLSTAIDRGRRAAFGAMDDAWLEPPDSVQLVAARRRRRRARTR